MTARRGSLRFKVTQLAGAGRHGKASGRAAVLQTTMQRSMNVAGKVVAVCAGALVALTVGAQVWRVGLADYQLHQQVVALENQNRALAQEAVTLRKEIYLSRNPEYLVPLIHEQLGLAKPHEVFVRLVPIAAGQAAATNVRPPQHTNP
jgi:cell division protein FtsB